MRAIGSVVLFCAAIGMMLGCAGDQAGEVSGTVVYDGKPVTDGMITFFPDKGPTAGSTIKDGKYSTKVALGPAKVFISASKVVGEKKVYPTPNSPVMPVTAEALPAKYNEASTLRYDVQPGSQTKDFTLEK